MAILHGLRIMKNKSILDRVIVESDSLLAVEIINEGCNSNHSSFPIAMNVIELLKEGSVVTCSHIFREVNIMVDDFAKQDLSFVTP